MYYRVDVRVVHIFFFFYFFAPQVFYDEEHNVPSIFLILSYKLAEIYEIINFG